MELNNSFNKRKKIKRIRVKLKKIKQKNWLKDEIERKKTSTKMPRIKLEILKNKYQKKIKYIRNYNWITKLKRIKTFINEKWSK